MPEFLDSFRITRTFEHGIILGIIFGFGIFVTRVIVERFPESNTILRIGLATLLGGLLMNVAIFIYDVLFLDTVPKGILISAGCFIIALGFAVSGLMHGKVVRMLITAAAVLAALAGSWWGHLLLSRSGINMTPLLFYEYLWTSSHVLIIMIIVTLPMSILSNLGDLSPKNN
jgi:hypothetical protein